MSPSTLTVTDETIATITLKRAHCLDIAGMHALTDVFLALMERDDLSAAILAADHRAAWLVDVAELAEMSPTGARAFSSAGHRLADTIAALPMPVIAAVDSPALGGGCELVLACDLALAGANARFGQIEAMGGVLPAFGGTWRLGERVGRQKAFLMMAPAEVLDPAAAKMAGLVLDAVPSANLLAAAHALVERVANVSRQSVAAIKRITRTGVHLPPDAIAALEEETFAALFATDDQRRRMRAFLAQQANTPKELQS